MQQTGSNLTTDNSNCITCNAKSPLFKLLKEDELRKMNEGRCRVIYRPGETIRKQGAQLSHVISVNEGYCKMYLEGIESRDIILRIIKPVNFIGGPGLYVDFRHHFTVRALTDVSVCFIDSTAFKQIMELNSNFARDFMGDMSRNMISVYNRIISLTQKQMAGRMADTLIYLADEVFERRKFDWILTRHELAEFAHMSKDSVVRILKSFDADNLIRLSEKGVEILDYDKLLRISSTG